jgi:hypothetical protein
MVSLLVLLMACDADRSSPPDLHPIDTDDPSVDSAPDDTAPDTAPDDTGPHDTGPPPHDADGDGHDAPAYGGDDCDDADAWTYPGAEEWCDPVDHDCNGDPLEEGVCGKVQSGEAVLRTVAGISDVSIAEGNLVSDLDGDGLAEMLLGCSHGCFGSAERGFLAYRGPERADRPREAPAGASAEWHASGGMEYVGREIVDGGDVDGDGRRDAVFPVNGEDQGLYIFYGPIVLEETVRLLDGADEVYTSSEYGGSWGYPVVGGEDFDGDGRSDFAADVYDTGYDVFFGGSGSTVRLIWDGDVPDMTPIGDVDGDGLTDLYFGLAWVSGSMLRTGDGARVSDIASGWWDFSPDEWTVSDAQRERVRGIGDWDGDGHPEVAMTNIQSSTLGVQQGEVYFFGGDLAGPKRMTDAEGSLVGSEAAPCCVSLATTDVDADGKSDLFGSSYVSPQRSGESARPSSCDDGRGGVRWYRSAGRCGATRPMNS